MRSTSIYPQCKGYGKVVENVPSGANKDGMIPVEETIKIKIPRDTVVPDKIVLSLFFLIDWKISFQRSILNIL